MDTITNKLGERMPGAMVVSLGQKEARKGWTLRHDAKYHNAITAGASAATHAIGRRTSADIEAGWHFSGPLADRIRRRKISAASQEDWTQNNPLTNFGVSGQLWEKMRFRGSWKRRHTQGWSTAAVVDWYLYRLIDSEQINFDGWSMGAPKWYADHQP